MGLYLNPNADAFMEDKGTRIYVDKSLLIRDLSEHTGGLGIQKSNTLLCPTETIDSVSEFAHIGGATDRPHMGIVQIQPMLQHCHP